MYKLWNDSANGYITWGPPDLNLAKTIVEEVTGKKTSLEDPVQVTEDQVEKIHELYGERNHDPKSVEEQDKEVEVSKAEIMLGMTSMYEEMLKKDTENKLAMAEIYESILK